MNTKLIATAIAAAAIAAAPAPAGAAARPDLRVTMLVDPPSALRVGDEFSSLARVTNSGVAKAGKATITRFYLTTDARDEPRQVPLQSRDTHRLRPGSSTFVSLRSRVPQGVAVSKEYSLVACVDATRRVRESDERHNCFASVFFVVFRAVDQ
jgi:hypothetical protein